MNLERLINDNPNLSCPALHKLTGVKYQTIYSTKTRLGAHRSFQHKGCGIPLVSIDTSRGLNYKVRIKAPSQVVL